MNQDTKIIRPVIGDRVYIAETAYVGGEVVLGDECTVMHHAVIRGDVSSIRIGRRVNVQDGAVVHTKTGVPLDIGDETAIGHRAVVHCRRVGAHVLIGIGAVVLDDSEIGDGAVIGAGAVIPPNTIVPPGKLVVGVPGKILRDVSDTENKYIDYVIEGYWKLNRKHAAGEYPNWREADRVNSGAPNGFRRGELE